MRPYACIVAMVLWVIGSPSNALELNAKTSKEITSALMSAWGSEVIVDLVTEICGQRVPAMSEKFDAASNTWRMRNRDALETAAFVHKRFTVFLEKHVQSSADRIMIKQFRKKHLVTMGESYITNSLKKMREQISDNQFCTRTLAAIESGKFDPQTLHSKGYQSLLHYKRVLEAPIAKAMVNTYPDGRGGRIRFPLGNRSFADTVTSFAMGTPAARDANPRNPKNLLRTPNYKKGNDRSYTTLGCKGTIVVRFRDNVLINVDGADLHVFEIGDQVEPTHLWISSDGKRWVDVGKISGGRAAVDIAPFVRQGDMFRYVKLKDLGASCTSNWPGADIDAVGAIGATATIELTSDMLFPLGQTKFKSSAADLLDAIVMEARNHKRSRIHIDGYTDNGESAAERRAFSARQAEAVRAYLSRSLEASTDFKVRGLGGPQSKVDDRSGYSSPTNRRIEITIVPLEPSPK